MKSFFPIVVCSFFTPRVNLTPSRAVPDQKVVPEALPQGLLRRTPLVSFTNSVKAPSFPVPASLDGFTAKHYGAFEACIFVMLGIGVGASRRYRTSLPMMAMNTSLPDPQEPRMARRAAVALAALSLVPAAAQASGGATAGKYTTIPIAKRRYFGRVQQGVYQFILVGNDLQAGNLSSPTITEFFADTIQVSKAKQKRQCIGDDKSCTTQEKFSSRWEDMKLSMYLLGNAFRMDSGKPPEKVKQVKEAKVFFTQVEKLQKEAKAGNKKGAVLAYAAAQEALDIYLNDVDLPPIRSGQYAGEADLSVPSLCQGSFCI
jgi:hypothetical protein